MTVNSLEHMKLPFFLRYTFYILVHFLDDLSRNYLNLITLNYMTLNEKLTASPLFLILFKPFIVKRRELEINNFNLFFFRISYKI